MAENRGEASRPPRARADRSLSRYPRMRGQYGNAVLVPRLMRRAHPKKLQNSSLRRTSSVWHIATTDAHGIRLGQRQR